MIMILIITRIILLNEKLINKKVFRHSSLSPIPGQCAFQVAPRDRATGLIGGDPGRAMPLQRAIGQLAHHVEASSSVARPACCREGLSDAPLPSVRKEVEGSNSE